MFDLGGPAGVSVHVVPRRLLDVYVSVLKFEHNCLGAMLER